jgi:UMF1 family MFS transporter
MYVKSAAVALQAIGIISLGPLADAPWWRKRLLIACAAVGSLSAALFTVLPAGPKSWLPPAAAGITVIANAAYAASIVCANAFLPALAREDPDVRAAKIEMEVEAEAEAAGQVRAQGGESGEEENGSRHRVSHEDEDANVEHETHALLGATTSSSTSTRAAETYAALLSSTTARLSSTGTAIGFFSGVAMLVLLLIPVTRGKGSTGSLELAVGLSGLWWAVFTVPAAHGLPGGPRTPAPSAWLAAAWARAGALLRPAEVRALPNLFMYLLAWVFLSDGELTIPRS